MISLFKMETAISTMTLLPCSKEQVSNFASQLMAEVEAGYLDPLTITIWLKWMEKLKETLDPQIKDNLLKEAAKYGKSFERMGFKIEQAEAGTKYDYNNCGDSSWEEYDADERIAKERKKIRENFLKALKEPITIVDEETGEAITIHPPVKSSISTLKFSAL